MHLQSPKGVERGRQPPARSILHSAWIRFYPLLTPPSFLPPHVFVLNIHLLAHLRQRQLAAQVFFSFHTHTDTQPQHVQRNQTHLKSVHKRGEKKQKTKNKKTKTSTLHSPQRLHAHLCTYSTLH